MDHPFPHSRAMPAAAAVLAWCLFGIPAHAQTQVRRPAPAPHAGAVEADVFAASQAYKEALARGDADAVRAMWTEDGDIIDDSGSVTRGRDAAEGLAPPQEGAPRPAFTIDSADVRLLSETVAIEDGSVTVTPPGAATPHHGRFTATWVKRPEGWRVASLREWRTDPPEDGAALEALDWLVGDWEVAVNGTEGEAKPELEMSVRWNRTHTYLVRETRVTPPDGGPALEVSQRIGWDPLTRRIRSWSFSSDGGHSEAVWTLENGVWVARTMSVLPDGTLSRAINHYVYDGADECTFQSLPTHAGGEQVQPTTMTMTRKHGSRSE